jgi:guanosine-3',5'-bis(diphosphate) 3'-pyrophosphohydrolase
MAMPIDEYRALLESVSFAARAHHGHMRKDKVTPYVSHVFRVCLIARHIFGLDDARILTAAILHDTIEDTLTDFDDLAEQNGPEIARWVAILSKNKKLPEEERERAYIADLNAAPWQVKACKLADLLDNLLDLDKLPPEKRSRSKKRYLQYWKAFRQWEEVELERAKEIVAAAIEAIG